MDQRSRGFASSIPATSGAWEATWMSLLRSFWFLFCISAHAAYVMGDISILGVIVASFFPGTNAEQIQVPKFGEGSSISFDSTKGSATSMIIRAGRGSGQSSRCRNCEGFVLYAGWALPLGMVRWQLFSDFVISIAFFSVPIQLYFIVRQSAAFPYRLMLVQFGSFVSMLGLSHFIQLFSYGGMPRVLMLGLTATKLLTAFVSCTSAVTLGTTIPDLLNVHEREVELHEKVDKLDKDAMELVRKEDEEKHLGVLIQRIRATLDRSMIVSTSLLELRDMLRLENAALWLPSPSGDSLELTNECERRPTPCLELIPFTESVVSEIISQGKAKVIPERSSLAMCSCLPPPLGLGWAKYGAVAAVPVPLEFVNQEGEGEHKEGQDCGIMVMVKPADGGKKWKPEQLQMVDSIASQMSVALVHASMLEESRRAHESLLEEEESLKQAELEGKSAVKARDNFLQVMNARMRTPMHAITALSSLLAESDLIDEQRQMAETVAFSSTLLSTLLQDILEYWRLEEANVTLLPEQFELPALVKEAETLSSPIAKDKGIMLIVKAEPSLPENVVGDGNRLLTVLLNVIGNSIKYTKEGQITVTASMEKMESARNGFVLKAEAGHVFVRFEVKDTGVDLNPADIPKMFEKFQDDDSKASRTGLGLALSKKFVEMMDGHIWIESLGAGKGAICRFVVRLELDSEEKDEEKDEWADDGPDVNFFALRIMVVDDNMVNRLVTKRLLDRIGISTKCVDSGRECLRILAEEQEDERYDVLLLDLMMPEMDGYTVAKKIGEELKPELRPMIVALTANADETTKEQCLKHGMAGMITKPISLNALRDVLGKMLDQNAHK